MLFNDINIKKNEVLSADFERLFDDALENQTHSGDLLLVQVNGFYNPDIFTNDNIPDKGPYMLGMGFDGHSDLSHYEFINKYRLGSLSGVDYTDYLKLHEFSEERIKEINELEQREALTIQLEMLIYLKIWEADLFIKKLYQITNLSLGLPYDWHFKISESNRDYGATGKRDELIRKKIRDRLQPNYPALYNAIKNSYKTQIRNAIAHSMYFCTSRYIHLTNYIKLDQASQIKVLPFDKWIDIIHDTLSIYNQLIGFCNKIDQHYCSKIKEPDETVTIRLNRKVPEAESQFIKLYYRKEYNNWHL